MVFRFWKRQISGGYVKWGLDKVRRREGAELDACDWLRCFCLWRLCDSPSIFSEEIPFFG